MSNEFPIEVFHVSGSNYEMGFEIGSHFKQKIKRFVESSETLKSIRGNLNERKHKELIEIANKHFHLYMEEIRGISEGSGIDYNDLILLNFKYEYPTIGCSTVIFKDKDRIVLGHNEDGERENENNAFILVAKPDKGTPFLVYCYPGMIPGNAFSFNSRGIVMTGNAMPTPDPILGIPRHLIDRSMLEASSIEDALDLALLPERASGFSYNIVSLNEKRAVNLETTSRMYYVTEVEDRFFHTNHYVSTGLRGIVQRVSESSRIRYEHGVKMMSNGEGAPEKRILEILYSTLNEPNSIYNPWTLCTAIFDVSDDIHLTVYARKERNCKPIEFSTEIFDM